MPFRSLLRPHPARFPAASCLTHISHKFKEARQEHPRITARILLLIGRIYQVEARLRNEGAGPLYRQRARWLESRKPYDHLAKLMRRVARFRGITSTSYLGKALAYATNQWVHLEPCFMDGQIEFDNNLTYAAHGISQIMPPPDLCRVHKLEAHVPVMYYAEPYSHAA